MLLTKYILRENLESIRFCSFIWNEEVVNEYNTFYLKFSNNPWSKLILSEGKLELNFMAEEPLLKGKDDFKDEFKYPISELSFKKDDYKNLKRIFKSEMSTSLCIAVSFEFENHYFVNFTTEDHADGLEKMILIFQNELLKQYKYVHIDDFNQHP